MKYESIRKEVEDLYLLVRDSKLSIGLRSAEVTTANGEVAFSGTGFLDQQPDGGFRLRLMVVATDRKWVAEINRAIPHETNTLFGFKLTDEQGRKWVQGELVKPYLAKLFSAYDNAYRGNHLQIVIDTPVIHLTDIDDFLDKAQKENDEMSRCDFIVPKTFNIPTPHHHRKESQSNVDGKREEISFDHYKTSIMGYRFQIRERKSDGYLIGSFFGPEKEFPPFVDQKILEVLMFLSASVFNFPLLLRNNKKQRVIRISGVVPASHSNLPPPLERDDFWPAFDTALAFLISDAPSTSDFFPSFSAALNLMYAGFGTKANHDVSVSVAVETALNNCSLADSRDDELPSKESISDIGKAIGTLGLDESIENRIRGMVGNLSRWSATDRLYKLEKVGHISERQIKAWKKIRHRTAHGVSASMGDADYGDLYSLLYKIILLTVGYSGDPIDYGDMWAQKSEAP